MLLVGLQATAAAQVHQQGVTAVDFTLSRTGVGIQGGAAYARNFSDNAFYRVRGFAEFGRLYNFKYSQFGSDLSAYYSPFFISHFFQVNIGGGVTLGYEKVGGVSKEKSDGIGFQVGAKVGAEIEAFLADRLSFFVSGQQAYMVKKSLGRNYYEVGIGMRIFLNNYY